MTPATTLIAFTLIGLITLGAALASVLLRNPVHCGLSLALTFIGMGAFFLLLGAEFVGFVQLLVSVGAVAILIMFVILLTRPTRPMAKRPERGWFSFLPGLGIAVAVFAVLVVSINGSDSLQREASTEGEISIEALGQMLVSGHLLPLQITGVMLTAALIGGVLFALKEGEIK